MAALGRAAAGRRRLGRCKAAEVQQDAHDHEPVAAMLQRRAFKPQHLCLSLIHVSVSYHNSRVHANIVHGQLKLARTHT